MISSLKYHLPCVKVIRGESAFRRMLTSADLFSQCDDFNRSHPGGVRHKIRPIIMRYFKSDFHAWQEPVFRGVYGEIFTLFQACVNNIDTIPPWKVVGTLS